MKHVLLLAVTSLIVLACGGDGSEADRLGVAGECTVTENCSQEPVALTCIPPSTFKGGYCGIVDCTLDTDCPDTSRCVSHEDGKNYCFRVCQDKALDCNANRSPDNEANCSANVTFADTSDTARVGEKACVPPSGS